MEQKMIEHHAAVTVDAPVHQVYSLFSHFNDFPKFMSFVKEVTYHDDQRSHWVADVAGRHEWDAVNEDWVPDRQIGWRSFSGLNNAGRVLFQPTSAQQTHIDVYVDYDPPAGLLGDIGERLGVGRHFEDALQKDLNHFAEMVHQAPAGALDPTSSNYLFHKDSAAASGTTTERQDATMGRGSSASEQTREDQASYTMPQDMNTASDASYTMPQDMNTASSASYTMPSSTGTPVRDEYATPSETGIPPQGIATSRENVPSDRPTLDRDIINEPANAAPQTGQRNTTVPPEDVSESEKRLPPEQIPGWESSENDRLQL